MGSDGYGEVVLSHLAYIQETLNGCIEHPFLLSHHTSALSQWFPVGGWIAPQGHQVIARGQGALCAPNTE